MHANTLLFLITHIFSHKLKQEARFNHTLHKNTMSILEVGSSTTIIVYGAYVAKL